MMLFVVDVYFICNFFVMRYVIGGEEFVCMEWMYYFIVSGLWVFEILLGVFLIGDFVFGDMSGLVEMCFIF